MEKFREMKGIKRSFDVLLRNPLFQMPKLRSASTDSFFRTNIHAYFGSLPNELCTIDGMELLADPATCYEERFRGEIR